MTELFADEIMSIAETFSEKLDKIVPLSGSPKQVEWANRIRSKITKNLIMYMPLIQKRHVFHRNG